MRWITEKKLGDRHAEMGVLAASGLIAGEALIGLASIAALWIMSTTMADPPTETPLFPFVDPASLGTGAMWDWITLAAFVGVGYLLFRTSRPSAPSVSASS